MDEEAMLAGAAALGVAAAAAVEKVGDGCWS